MHPGTRKCETSDFVSGSQLRLSHEGKGLPAAMDPGTTCFSPRALRLQAEVVCGQAPVDVRGPKHMGTA